MSVPHGSLASSRSKEERLIGWLMEESLMPIAELVTVSCLYKRDVCMKKFQAVRSPSSHGAVYWRCLVSICKGLEGEKILNIDSLSLQK